MKNIKISTVLGHVNIGPIKTMEEYVDDILSGNFKSQIMKLREKKNLGEIKEYGKLKRNLPSVLPHGVFDSRKDNKPPKLYSQLLALDIDHLEKQGIEPIEFKRLLSKDPYVICAHLSCSGDGMVVFIKHSAGVARHLDAVLQVTKYIEWNFKVAIDIKVSKSINNQRFISFDPAAYTNWDANTFELFPNGIFDLLEDQVNFTNQKVKFESGNRNNWLYLFSCNCNRKGVSEDDVIKYAEKYLQSFDFEMEEIYRTIKSAYKIDLETSNFDNSEHHKPEIEEILKETANGNGGNVGNTLNSKSHVLNFNAAPTFPEDLIEKLPELFQRVAITGETQIEIDLAILSVITGLSSLFPNVALFYDHVHYPNIFTMILANAGEGKSKVANTIKILNPLNSKLVTECGHKKTAFKKAKKEFDSCVECSQAPIKPDCKGLFVPEDVTHPALLDKLASKSEYNLFFSTEIDSVNRTMGNETFNKSDLFRKAFHHEPISHSRRTADLEIHIPEPKLSILITGTPATITGMIKGVEDGTSSRFIYYGFSSGELVWKSQQSESKVKAEENIRELSQKVLELFDFIKDRSIKFDFTATQKIEFDRYFELKTKLLDKDKDQYYFASVKRHGLIFKRIASILTIVEAFEAKNVDNKLLCSKKAFGACKEIIDTLLEHSKIVFSNLERRPYTPLTDPAEKLYHALPDEFAPRLGYKIAKEKLGISERSVRDYYKNLVKNKQITKVGNIYQKTQIATVAVAAADAVRAEEFDFFNKKQ